MCVRTHDYYVCAHACHGTSWRRRAQCRGPGADERPTSPGQRRPRWSGVRGPPRAAPLRSTSAACSSANRTRSGRARTDADGMAGRKRLSRPEPRRPRRGTSSCLRHRGRSSVARGAYRMMSARPYLPVGAVSAPAQVLRRPRCSLDAHASCACGACARPRLRQQRGRRGVRELADRPRTTRAVTSPESHGVVTDAFPTRARRSSGAPPTRACRVLPIPKRAGGSQQFKEVGRVAGARVLGPGPRRTARTGERRAAAK